MTTESELTAIVEEFKKRYRTADFPLDKSKTYFLNKDPNDSETFGWPDTWPHNSQRGVYAILSNDEVLYIGKASLQPVGKRLSNYFRYGAKRECITNPNHDWSSDPTHVVAWSVPDDLFFEASALEEYLIHALSPPDNTTGRRDA